MSQRKYDNWLKEFVDFASYGEAPTRMLFWTGVSTVAGALRRRVWIDQKYFQWIPNFYVILVAPPGIVSKSTTANIGMNLLRRVQGIHFGPDVVTWQSLVQSLAQSAESNLDESTGEYIPMCAVTIASDEFGTFLNPQDREMVDVLVSLWDGKQGVFRKETKMSGCDTIENPFINIIACTTPSWISGNFPEYMIGGGFTSRCVFVYTENKRQHVAYPALHIPVDFEDRAQNLVHDLEIISTIFGEYKLTPEAIQWGEQWYEKHWASPHAHLSRDQFGGYLARKQTHIHKLAMVMEASQHSERIIRPETLSAADELVSANENDMQFVFKRIGQTEITKGASEIVSMVQGKRLPQMEVYGQLFRTMSYQDFQHALQSAIAAGLVKVEQQGQIIYVMPAKEE